jgi:hypothetical protein
MMLRNTPATVVAMIILMIMPESSVQSVVSLTESLKTRKFIVISINELKSTEMLRKLGVLSVEGAYRKEYISKEYSSLPEVTCSTRSVSI